MSHHSWLKAYLIEANEGHFVHFSFQYKIYFSLYHLANYEADPILSLQQQQQPPTNQRNPRLEAIHHQDHIVAHQ